MKKSIVLILALLVLCACSFQQQQLQYPERWMYVMCIKHASKDIALSSMNVYSQRFSYLSPKKQEKEPEFKNFSIFGKRGIVDTEWSYIPQAIDKLNYVTNEIVLAEGDTITDFNGFTIEATANALVVSNGKKRYTIKEKQDWSDIESKGRVNYAGHIGHKYISEWQMFLWSIGLRDDMWDYPDPNDIKPHRFMKWCLSPIDKESCNFEIYTVYIPKRDVAWRKRNVWYKSTWK